MTTVPYRVADGKVTWGDQFDVSGGEDLGGYVIDHLRASFSETTDLLLTMRAMGIDPALFGLNDDEARDEADIATTRMLVALGAVVGLFSTERMRQRLADCPGVRVIDPDDEEAG